MKLVLSWVYTSGFCLRLPHCFAILYNLPWFCSIKVSNKKLQHNAENACGNRMCKHALKLIFFNVSKSLVWWGHYLNHFDAKAEWEWKCDKDEKKEKERDEEGDELSAKRNVLFLIGIVPNISDRIFLRHFCLETLGVNFINVLRTNFLYKCHFCSFF